MAPSRASDSIKLLSRSDHSASPQVSLHELLFAVSPPPVTADEDGFDTCTWYTNVNADSSYVNNHGLIVRLIRNKRVAKGTCPTIEKERRTSHLSSVSTFSFTKSVRYDRRLTIVQ